MSEFDIVIKDGLVIDGSGKPGYHSDLAIKDTVIEKVGSPINSPTATVIDASGCVVAPGFVDMHSHADLSLPLCPTAESLVQQGITTVVVGQCGFSAAPLLDATRTQWCAMLEARFYPLAWGQWSSFRDYLDYLVELGSAANIVPLVGHGTIRAGVMGLDAKDPTGEQIREMQVEVLKALEAGAIGVSTGLVYTPAVYADTEEIVALLEVAKGGRIFYFTHVRDESDNLLEALDEAISIGQATKAVVQISHFKAAGAENWSKSREGLSLIDAARQSGLDISVDMYPYLAGSSPLYSVLPTNVQEGDLETVLDKLSDLSRREEIISGMRSEGYFKVIEWDKVLISDSHSRRDYEGISVERLARKAGKSPCEWVLDALVETRLNMKMVYFSMSEDNRKQELQHPAMMFGTDGFALSSEGVLGKGVPHPRNYGTFPRVLGRYVREEKIIGPEEAIHKMSGMPAGKLGWTNRGLIKEGYKADVVIYDPRSIIDCASYEAPRQYPKGISHVIVNGQITVRNQVHTGARAGEILGEIH